MGIIVISTSSPQGMWFSFSENLFLFGLNHFQFDASCEIPDTNPFETNTKMSSHPGLWISFIENLFLLNVAHFQFDASCKIPDTNPFETNMKMSSPQGMWISFGENMFLFDQLIFNLMHLVRFKTLANPFETKVILSSPKGLWISFSENLFLFGLTHFQFDVSCEISNTSFQKSKSKSKTLLFYKGGILSLHCFPVRPYE